MYQFINHFTLFANYFTLFTNNIILFPNYSILFPNYSISFLDQCNVETASLLGIQGLSCSKDEGFEDSLFQKLFKAYNFYFLGVSIGRYVFEQFARETYLKKKRSVTLYVSTLCQETFMICHNFGHPNLQVSDSIFCYFSGPKCNKVVIISPFYH